VNASPSLSTTTDADRQLKFKVISDVLSLVVPDQFPESRTWTNRRPPGHAQASRRVGSFYVRVLPPTVRVGMWAPSTYVFAPRVRVWVRVVWLFVVWAPSAYVFAPTVRVRVRAVRRVGSFYVRVCPNG